MAIIQHSVSYFAHGMGDSAKTGCGKNRKCLIKASMFPSNIENSLLLCFLFSAETDTTLIEYSV